jgi:hypothetical protein
MGFGKRNQNTKEHKYPESFPSRISYTPPGLHCKIKEG